MKKDYCWLESWTPYLKTGRLLELGCGEGIDTRFIASHSEGVVACDLNPPKGSTFNVVNLDHSKNLPFRDREFNVVIASLCLHYFNLQLTKIVVNDLSRVLKKDGLLICRLNSVRDFNYGASGYPEIEPGMYAVKGQLKKFFTEAEIRDVFISGWRLIQLGEKTIDRYEKEKVVWEFGAVKL